MKLEWRKDQGSPTVALLWKTPNANAATSLWSEVGVSTKRDAAIVRV